MSHVAKAPKAAKAAKAPKKSAGAGKKRVTARRHARKTGPPKAKATAKHPDTRGKAHGQRRHEKIGSHHRKHHEKKHHEKPHHEKPHHEHHVTDKAHHHEKHREHRKHEHHTRYGLHHKAAAAARGAVKPAHATKAAHLPHNGTAHHEQYK